MDKAGFVGLFSWWQAASEDRGVAPALSTLYVQLGERSDAGTAKFLASQALDLTPGSIEALELLERLTPRTRLFELRERFEAFLAHAPFHRQAPRVRESLIHLLLERGDYGAAMQHVGALTRVGPAGAPSEEIVRACSVVPPAHEGVELIELDDVDLEPYEEYELVDDGYEWLDLEGAEAAE